MQSVMNIMYTYTNTSLLVLFWTVLHINDNKSEVTKWITLILYDIFLYSFS